MRSDLKKQIDTLILNITNDLSCELVEWSTRKRNGTVVIDIIADKPHGGITIDECTAINKSVVAQIEEQHWFGDDYVVEVASPGLDRTLKTANDFIRATGRRVRVHLKEPVDGKVEHHGLITGVGDDCVMIDRNGQTITIPLAIIAKAVQLIEY